MLLTIEMGISHLITKTDSQLVVGQATSSFQVEDQHLVLYLRYVKIFPSYLLLLS